MPIFIISHLSFEYHIYYIMTISNQITGIYCHIQNHFMTTWPITYITNGIQDFVKSCIKRCVHLDLRPDNMLLGGLQPLCFDVISLSDFPSLVTRPIYWLSLNYVSIKEVTSDKSSGLYGPLLRSWEIKTTKEHCCWWETTFVCCINNNSHKQRTCPRLSLQGCSAV